MTNGNEYFLKLGRFVHMFSVTEACWHLAFRAVAGIPEEIVRPITAGMRIVDIMAILKRVAKAKNVSPVDLNEINALAEQFQVISLFRDSLIHRGATPQFEKFVSTNLISMKSLEDYEMIAFTTKD